MKAILILILFTACDFGKNIYLNDISSGHEVAGNIAVDVKTIQGIGAFLKKTIEKRAESENVWANPIETYTRLYGDCEDFALLFASIAFVELDIKMDFAVVLMTEREIIEGGNVDHVTLVYEGVQYSPFDGSIVYYNIGYLYKFDHVFIQ